MRAKGVILSDKEISTNLKYDYSKLRK